MVNEKINLYCLLLLSIFAVLIFLLVLISTLNSSNAYEQERIPLQPLQMIEKIVQENDQFYNNISKNLCPPLANANEPLLGSLNASSSLIDFIIGFEGNAGLLDPLKGLKGDSYGLYNDPQNNCTVGIGHLVHFGKCNVRDVEQYKSKYPNGSKLADARTQLENDLTFIEKGVKDNVKVNLIQQQFDALVDFTFNEGVDILVNSKLLKDINEGNCDSNTITKDFQKITRGDILIDRRNGEANIFNSGRY